MTRKEMLRQLDKLRAEVEKDEPDLRDVMAKLEEIEARVQRIEFQKAQSIPYPVPYPVYPSYPRPYYNSPTIWCTTTKADVTTGNWQLEAVSS